MFFSEKFQRVKNTHLYGQNITTKKNDEAGNRHIEHKFNVTHAL